MTYKNYKLRLDSWTARYTFEMYLRYMNLTTAVNDCVGFAIQLMPKRFRLSYDIWLCRFYVSFWLMAFWIDLPRMPMLLRVKNPTQLYEHKIQCTKD